MSKTSRRQSEWTETERNRKETEKEEGKEILILCSFRFFGLKVYLLPNFGSLVSVLGCFSFHVLPSAEKKMNKRRLVSLSLCVCALGSR